jgi:hypothetical protein
LLVVVEEEHLQADGGAAEDDNDDDCRYSTMVIPTRTHCRSMTMMILLGDNDASAPQNKALLPCFFFLFSWWWSSSPFGRVDVTSSC